MCFGDLDIFVTKVGGHLGTDFYFSIPNMIGLTTGKPITFFVSSPCILNIQGFCDHCTWLVNSNVNLFAGGLIGENEHFLVNSITTECILRGFFEKELDEIKLRFENNSSRKIMGILSTNGHCVSYCLDLILEEIYFVDTLYGVESILNKSAQS